MHPNVLPAAALVAASHDMKLTATREAMHKRLRAILAGEPEVREFVRQVGVVRGERRERMASGHACSLVAVSAAYGSMSNRFPMYCHLSPQVLIGSNAFPLFGSLSRTAGGLTRKLGFPK
jgi:hypothetical protein